MPHDYDGGENSGGICHGGCRTCHLCATYVFQHPGILPPLPYPAAAGIFYRDHQGISAPTAGEVECRLYENIVDEEKGKLNEDGSLNLNPNSKTIVKAFVEPMLMDAKAYDSFQFVRNGFFCIDSKDSTPENLVFNRIVSLKSSFKLPKK